MLQELREYLAAVPWREGQPAPVVELSLYFEGNDEEECIAPNQWGEGRPPIKELYRRFQEIAGRPDVEKVLVGLHEDWANESYAEVYPPAENVHIYTSASSPEVQSWIAGLHADGAIKGWTYGKPTNAPEPSRGYSVFSVCWD